MPSSIQRTIGWRWAKSSLWGRPPVCRFPEPLAPWTPKLFLVLAWLAFCQVVSGAPTTASQAATVVRGWLRHDPTPVGEVLPSGIQSVEAIKDGAGGYLCFVVYLEPSGFAIVSPEDGVEPLIAFSSRGRFEASAANPLGALILNDLPKRVAKARRVGLAGEDAGVVACRGKWNRLKQASQQSALLSSSGVTPSDVRIAPLIQSLWSQSTVHGSVACYNYYTPPYEAGNASNYVAGCVATALAQLMRYYKYPLTSVGTNSFSIKVDGTTSTRRLRGGDGVGGPYSWADMPNIPISPTTIQCQAIGALLYDAGIASQMDYTATNSGATLNIAANALVNVFHFSKAICGNNSQGLGTALTAMINPNLDARRPVILGILGTVGGHAVVCDGYGYSVSTLYHHLNMGWADTNNAWYALPTITTGNGTFDTIQNCIYNAFTNGTGEIISGRVVDGGGLPVVGAAVSAVRSALTHTYSATTDTNGIYALVELPSLANFTINVAKTGYYAATKSASTSLSANYGANSGNVWGLDFNLSMVPVTLSLKADPVQAGTVSGGGEFVPGTLNQIEATAAAGWFFYRWQDDVRLNPRIVTIPASNVIYTASFVQSSKLSRLIASNSILTMSIQGTPGGVTRIDYSTNLAQWQPLATNLTNIGGTIYFSDMIGTNSPSRFYRAVIP